MPPQTKTYRPRETDNPRTPPYGEHRPGTKDGAHDNHPQNGRGHEKRKRGETEAPPPPSTHLLPASASQNSSRGRWSEPVTCHSLSANAAIPPVPKPTPKANTETLAASFQA